MDLINGHILSLLCFPGNRNHLHTQKRDSKSFDSGALYRPEHDEDSSNGGAAVSLDRMERIERSEPKIMLPTPPVRPSTIATAMAAKVPTANQSENSSSNENDPNRSDTNNGSDGLNDSNKNEDEDEKKPGEPNEV